MPSTSRSDPADRRLGGRFWLLWWATTTANLADGLSLVAFPLLAIRLTDDARLVALVTVARFLPFLLLGLPAGVVLDRLDRRRLGIAAQALRAAVIGAVAAIVALDGGSIAWVCLGAFAVGAGEVLTDGGLPAIVRSIVRSDQLELANARIASTRTVTNSMIGPPLGALLFEIDRVAPFVASLGLFVATAGLLIVLGGEFRADRSGDEPMPFRRELVEGLATVWRHPILRGLAFAVMTFSFAGQATSAISVVLAEERFGLGPLGFGLWLATDAVVSLLASLVVATFIARVGHGSSMRFAVVMFVLACVFFGSSTIVALAFVGAVFAGLSDPTWNVVSGTVRQRIIPDAVFGRTMTAYLFLSWSLNPIGALVGGVVAEAVGPQWVYLGAALIVGSLLVTARPLFAAITREMAQPT